VKTKCCGTLLSRIKETPLRVVHKCWICGREYSTRLDPKKVRVGKET